MHILVAARRSMEKVTLFPAGGTIENANAQGIVSLCIRSRVLNRFNVEMREKSMYNERVYRHYIQLLTVTLGRLFENLEQSEKAATPPRADVSSAFP